ncbi:MAG: hypothetical protein M0Z42_22370 [Actinomycetota bacterium]|nr:hypothetical protein [Actinomycetota bacterium]
MPSSNSLSGLSARGAQVAYGGQWVSQKVWSDGRPTDEPKLDEDGHPTYRLDCMLFVAASAISAAIIVGSRSEPPELEARMVPLPESATITVMGPRQGARGLTVQIHLPASALPALSGAHSPAAAAKVA